MTGALQLTDAETALLDGERGSGTAMAMRVVTGLARAMGAERLRPVTGAHIDSCLYHGRSGLDFVQVLVDGGSRVEVPTTLNVSSLDLLHPDLYRGDPETAAAARQLMNAYVALGCEPTWTCAPYQRQVRPGFGEHLAWAESNAIVFANSVLGARTNRYGDFIDIAAAVTGRVPDAGLHRDENRRATMVFDAADLPAALLADPISMPLIGLVVGRRCGNRVPAIVGLPADVGEDGLKALGAAAASSGSVALFHVVGVTPEATTLDEACGGEIPPHRHRLTVDELRTARDGLCIADHHHQPLTTVSLGTPHYSVGEIGALHEALAGRRIHPSVDVYVSTGREVLAEVRLRGWEQALIDAGVTFVTDTCTYITPIVADKTGVAMTDSAKWAYYAPGNIGVQPLFAGLGECVESAVAGAVVLDDNRWSDDDRWGADERRSDD